MQNNTFLTLKQCRETLQIGRSLMLDLIHRNAIPAFKVGNQWRIRKVDLDRYAEKNLKGGYDHV